MLSAKDKEAIDNQLKSWHTHTLTYTSKRGLASQTINFQVSITRMVSSYFETVSLVCSVCDRYTTAVQLIIDYVYFRLFIGSLYLCVCVCVCVCLYVFVFPFPLIFEPTHTHTHISMFPSFFSFSFVLFVSFFSGLRQICCSQRTQLNLENKSDRRELVWIYDETQRYESHINSISSFSFSLSSLQELLFLLY